MFKCSIVNLGHTSIAADCDICDVLKRLRLEASKRKPMLPRASYLGATLSNKSRLGCSEKYDFWKLKLDQQYWNDCVWVWTRTLFDLSCDNVLFHVCGFLVSNISIHFLFLRKHIFVLYLDERKKTPKNNCFLQSTQAAIRQAEHSSLTFKFCTAQIQNYYIVTCDLRARCAEV